MRYKIHHAANYINEHLGTAEIAVVLGSGLGDFVGNLENSECISYSDIPEFPVSTVSGHAGKLWIGTLHGKRVFIMQGRFHYFEGYKLNDIAMYVRVFKLLGVRTLILTNAAGCVNLDWKAGDLMILNDFINYTGRNPLIGENLDEFGPRFPDMTYVYTPSLIRLCHEEADRLGILVREGVYMWFTGPCYETPAEIRMARILGADAVGMSTVPESIAARHCGMDLLGISCLTNMAAGILEQPLSHQEIVDTAVQAKGSLSALLSAVIARIE